MRTDIQQGMNVDILRQIKLLDEIVTSHEILIEVIHNVNSLNLNDYYIGAGCITQTVWNYQCGYSLDYGISDIDIVYFDSNRMTLEDEEETSQKAHELFKDIPFQIDIVNQARVHLWYEQQFGFPIKPYISVESAINTWPTTASAIGIRKRKNELIEVYAPFGLNDLFGMIVRANKQQITKEIFEAKATKWKKKWPELTIIPWEK